MWEKSAGGWRWVRSQAADYAGSGSPEEGLSAVTDVKVATALTLVRSERERNASAGYAAAPLQFRRRILVIAARTPIRAVLADALLRHRKRPKFSSRELSGNILETA